MLSTILGVTGLPIGGWWENTTGRKETRMYWHGDDRDKLFEYMGEPLPGFEYKWPERFNTIATQDKSR